MVPYEQVSHRSSALKQQNKKHNILGHRTKGQVASLCKGRVNVVNEKKCRKAGLSKLQRRHQAKQIQSFKRKEVINKKRFLGTDSKPPFLITIIALHNDINFKGILNIFENIEDTCVTKSEQGLLHISYTRLKQRFSFVVPPQKDLYAILDAVKVSDTVLLVWKLGESLDSEKDSLLSCLKYQGFPSVVHLVTGDEDMSQKKKIRAEKELKLSISSHFTDNPKLYSIQKYHDVMLLFRQICSHKRSEICFRDRRMHMVGEKVSFVSEGTVGTMEVSGYIRGRNITANELIHIPGWGDFQISSIYSEMDPHPLDLNTQCRIQSTFEPQILSTPDSSIQESLRSERVISEDMKESNEDSKIHSDDIVLDGIVSEQKVPKKIPKGVSDYQAAWILSDDEGEDKESDEEDLQSTLSESFAPKSVMEEESVVNEEEEEDNETMTMTDAGDDYDEGYDLDEDINELKNIKAANEDVSFPDEIDTPMNASAKERFKKYRGLESFRTSPWVQNENLPDDYAKIYQFKDFKHVKKMVLKEDKEGIEPGNYVKICLKEVPRHLFEENRSNSYPFILFSLLKHEQKMSVLNIVLKSNSTGHFQAIRSKEKLIFHVGIRRFCNNPIFSEHTNGDKFKFSRFFHPGQTLVATIYAPITYPPCPVSVFQRKFDGSQVLVATGSVYSVNPNRIICKRVILSGHPFKVNKKSAVIRYMFFNSSDINWFKPIELRTKWGKKGHICEPLGTHGHMKCKFNGQLKSQDTVMMKLYKRVFPKWHYDPYVESPLTSIKCQPLQTQLTSTNLKEFCQNLESRKKKKIKTMMDLLKVMKLQE